MEHNTQFRDALISALNFLDRDRKGPVQPAVLQPLLQTIRDTRARRLRKAAAKLTELDVDIMEDLMRVVKKLGKGAANDKEDFETRLGLALRLLEKLKPAPDSAEMLVWNLNEIYKKVDWIIAQEQKQQLKEKGGVV